MAEKPATRELLSPQLLARLERMELVSRKVFRGRLKGERRSRRKGQSVEFADFRNYVPGDDLRFIDWNVFARLDRLFIKLFLEEEDLALYILVDASKSADYGTPNKLAYMKRVAAALGYVGLVNYNRVHLAAVGDGVVAETGGMRGRRSVPRMLDFVDALRPEGRTDFAAACKQFALRNRNKGVLVMISDFFDKAGFEHGLRYVANSRYDLFAVHVLSPQEVEPDVRGDLKLIDLEDGDAAEVSINGPLLEKYKANLNAYCLAVKEYVTRRGGQYLFASTEVPFDQLVLNYLRQKGLLR
jgi:uncharacterized protein (DUF58 family)